MQLYRAVVEDNNSPNKDGRVRVRIHGIHTEKNENSGESFEFIKTTDLPWAEVMGGAAFGLVGGVGLSNILQQGTWVWVTLENDDPNFPIVIGTITGKISSSSVGTYDSGVGFVDPDGLSPQVARSSEHDFNRLARNEQLDAKYYDENCPILDLDTTIHNKINSTVDVQTGKTDSITGADVSQTEPNSTSDSSVYPKNTVLETSSGHVIELDDTADNERLRVYHRTGSYIEIKPDGTFVQKCVNTDSASHYIHMSDVENHVAKSVRTYIEENLDEIIEQNVKRAINGTLDEHIVLEVNRQMDHNQRENITGGEERNIDLDLIETVGGFFQLTATGSLEFVGDVKITGGLEVTGETTLIGNMMCNGEVADSVGDLDSLRQAYDDHHHIGNLGVPTSKPIITDPKDRTEVDPWENDPQGFL